MSSYSERVQEYKDFTVKVDVIVHVVQVLE
jgi:hypothetical protein